MINANPQLLLLGVGIKEPGKPLQGVTIYSNHLYPKNFWKASRKHL